MREQAAVAHQMMDQLGRRLEAGLGGNPNGPGVTRSILNLLSSKRQTHLVSEESLTLIRLMSGLRQWRKFSSFWIVLTTRMAFTTYILEADAEF